jgi:hypothetical protein
MQDDANTTSMANGRGDDLIYGASLDARMLVLRLKALAEKKDVASILDTFQ